VAVLGGRYLGAYWRIAGQDQWMTTIRAGGRYAAADPPIEAIDLAVRAANHFGLVFTGVDLMEAPDGGFVVLEVSAFGGFRGLLDACGIDADPALGEVLAGPPGAGKSTAALHLVERGFRFLSNDRVLARSASDSVEALGYPKQPRVNPGTLVHHPRLGDLLEPGDRRVLEALSPAELWRLERKRDVDLDTIYGKGTVELRGRMQARTQPCSSGFRWSRSPTASTSPLWWTWSENCSASSSRPRPSPAPRSRKVYRAVILP
jgi:hypothetical protein